MNRALILIDLQNDYFPGGNMELVGIEQAADNARRLLDHFRTTGSPVIHIQHLSLRPGASFFLPGSSGAEINAKVAPRNGESVVEKHFPNGFRSTLLLDILHKNQIDTLVICGAMSHMCIDATTRAAFDLGFNCILAHDACATRDLVFKDRTVPATEVHASFMAALAIPYAQVAATTDILIGKG